MSSRPLKKKNECWSLFHIPPPPCLHEGCQRQAATPMVPEVLMRRVSLRPQVFGKTKLLTFYHMAGIVKQVNASCMAGTAWIYGVRICMCFLRYRVNALLDHLPFTFMMSKGMPWRRYSRVEPILIPCPCRGSRPAARAALASSAMNFDFVRGRWPALWR